MALDDSSLAQAPLQAFRGTSISDGLAFAKSHFGASGYESPRRVIDVSGDGANNMGMPIELAREEVVQAGITINGLPIMIKRAGDFLSVDNLDVYYQDCVIGGSGAFVVVVKSADNGVAASPNGKQIFIAGSGDDTGMRLSLDSAPGKPHAARRPDRGRARRSLGLSLGPMDGAPLCAAASSRG